jgi:competence ComEA-like helix-hairpin-helix protein
MKLIQLEKPHKRLSQCIAILLGLMWLITAHAESNPRYLSTNFEDYKKQQALHDQRLMQTQSSQGSSVSGSRTAKSQSQAQSKSTNQSNNQQATISAKDTQNSQKININQADEQTIMNSLKGIGAVKAKAIVDYRNTNGQFKRAEDLLLVKGIGAVTLSKNQDLLRFD